MKQGISIGAARAALAPSLTAEDVAELLALAEFSVSVGGSLTFDMRHLQEPYARWEAAGLTIASRHPGMTPGSRKVRLTELGWLVLLDRCRDEMQHFLPPEEHEDGE